MRWVRSFGMGCVLLSVQWGALLDCVHGLLHRRQDTPVQIVAGVAALCAGGRAKRTERKAVKRMAPERSRTIWGSRKLSRRAATSGPRKAPTPAAALPIEV